MTEKKKMGRPLGATKWPHAVVEQALLAMAYTRQPKAALAQLEMAGVDPLPPLETVRDWKRRYSGRLAELTEQFGAEIERQAVSGYLDVIAEAQELERVLIRKTLEAAERDEIPARDLSGAARNASTTKAINIDKVLLYQGKPTKIIGREKDAEEALRGLADKFAVDGSSENDVKELGEGDE